MVQFSVQSSQLSKGYDAFNAANPDSTADENDAHWSFMKSLFCADTPFAESAEIEFPVWYPMDGGDPLRGWNEISAELQRLRGADANAQLLMVADHGENSITLDFTTGGPEGAHLCADKVEFDEQGLIRVFWHCSTNTHQHGHAGHEAGHSHSPQPAA
jgi:hypothetical protein